MSIISDELREPARMESPTHSTAPPDWSSTSETAQLRAAAIAAGKRYPGPVGQLLAHDLLSWSSIGMRWDTTGLIGRVVAELLAENPI